MSEAPLSALILFAETGSYGSDGSANIRGMSGSQSLQLDVSCMVEIHTFCKSEPDIDKVLSTGVEKKSDPVPIASPMIKRKQMLTVFVFFST